MSDTQLPIPQIGVGVLLWRDKKVLLGERINVDGSRCWQFPGGSLEPGESVSECARRELMEEAGLKLHEMRLLGFTDEPFEIENNSYITLLVSGLYESGEARAREPDKCVQWKWFDYLDLPAPLFKPIRNFLQQQPDLYDAHYSAPVIPGMPSNVHK